jgi:hypothetical protein
MPRLNVQRLLTARQCGSQPERTSDIAASCLRTVRHIARLIQRPCSCPAMQEHAQHWTRLGHHCSSLHSVQHVAHLRPSAARCGCTQPVPGHAPALDAPRSIITCPACRDMFAHVLDLRPGTLPAQQCGACQLDASAAIAAHAPCIPYGILPAISGQWLTLRGCPAIWEHTGAGRPPEHHCSCPAVRHVAHILRPSASFTADPAVQGTSQH